MKLPALLFALACAIALVLGAAVWAGGEAPPQARPHPEFPTLLQGGDGAARSAPMLALPQTWTPRDMAHRISLCHTAGTRSK